MNQPGNKKEERGLILIELLLAMAIFAVSMVAILGLFINATQGVIIGLEKDRGILLSNEALEAALAISRYDQDYLTPGKYEVGVNLKNQWTLIPKGGLISHYLLANNASDITVNRNHGIASRVIFREDRKGQPLAAAVFNGENSYIKTEYALSLQIEGPLTLSAWVEYLPPETAARTVAGRQNAYILYKENDSYFFKVYGSNRTASVSARSDGLPWEHIAGVYDPGGPTLRLYVNGKEKASEEINITSLNKSPGEEFFIGAKSGMTDVWQGRISDVRVYQRALISQEIAGLHNSYSVPYEKNLVVSDLDKLAGTWNFNEGEGCTIHDNSGHNNHAMVKECSLGQWTENRHEKTGRAFSFENNNYLEIADSQALQLKNQMLISLWIRMPEELPEENMTIFHKRATGPEDYSFSLIYLSAEGQKGWGWAAAKGRPEEFSQILFSETIITERWQHIMVSFDGTTKKMYVDNKEATVLEQLIVNNRGDNARLFIGRNPSGQKPLSGAAIDDLRIYREIPGPAEKQAIFLGKTNYFLE